LSIAPKEHIEVNKDHEARLILSGQWLYDNMVPKPVRILALNYDFYFELDEGYLEEGQEPELNKQGEQYVVVWHNEPFFSASDFPSNGFMTVADAKKYAESVVRKIDWQEPVSQKYV
jgi:hypothetical protein